MGLSQAHNSVPILFTRCPECQTTFRITPELLAKADGQVRCGRCHAVFDAFVDLRERIDSGTVAAEAPACYVAVPDEDPLARTDSYAALAEDTPAAESEHAGMAPESDIAAAQTPEPATPAPDASLPQPPEPATGAGLLTPAATADSAAPAPDPFAPADRPTDEHDPESLEDLSLVRVIEEIERSSLSSPEDSTPPQASDTEHAEAAPEPADAAEEVMSPAQVAAVLEPKDFDLPGVPGWPEGPAEPAAIPRRRGWTALSVLAAIALALQGINHFRDTLAKSAHVGPALRSAYAYLGIALPADVDLSRYEIVEWTATAEKSADGQDILRIVARVGNQDARAQPFPHLRLKLTDRWEATLGSRVFGPAEYLAQDAAPPRSIPAGGTVPAMLAVADPGPDAYGFELDICAPQADGRFLCASDSIFQ